MSETARSRLWAIVAAMIFISACLAALASRRVAPVVREIEGRIVKIDHVGATAALAFSHPRTGVPLRVTGHITPTCVILIDGRQGSNKELSAGDLVRVTVEVHPIGRRIDVVRVERHSPDNDELAATESSGSSRSASPEPYIHATYPIHPTGERS